MTPRARPVGPRRFETTHWSLVLAAREAEPAAARHALEALCETYWYPLYAHIRRAGHTPADAEDLTQAFMARLIERRWFEAATREKGRLRSFMLRSLDNFLSNQARSRRAARRGGGTTIVPIEPGEGERRYVREPPDLDTPDVVFDRQWALAIIEGAIEKLAADADARGRRREFDTLRSALAGEADRGDYAGWARTLGTSEGAVKVAVHRLRRRFRDRVRRAIAATLAEPAHAGIDEELDHLLRVLRRPAGGLHR